MTIDELAARMDKRFDAVDERFDGVDKRFDAVDERFDGADERFERVDRDRGTIIGAILDLRQDMNNRFEAAAAKVEALDVKFTDKFNKLDHKSTNRIDDLDAHMNERFDFVVEGLVHVLPLHQKVNLIEQRLSRVESKLHP